MPWCLFLFSGFFLLLVFSNFTMMGSDVYFLFLCQGFPSLLKTGRSLGGGIPVDYLFSNVFLFYILCNLFLEILILGQIYCYFRFCMLLRVLCFLFLSTLGEVFLILFLNLTTKIFILLTLFCNSPRILSAFFYCYLFIYFPQQPVHDLWITYCLGYYLEY